jgi:hypothetical protein
LIRTLVSQLKETLPASLFEKLNGPLSIDQATSGSQSISGKENSVIGYEKSERLDVKPAEYFVMVTKREKRACKACQEGVACAPGASSDH